MVGDKDPVKGSRVMQAKLQMNKIDIKGLQQAYDGGYVSANTQAGCPILRFSKGGIPRSSVAWDFPLACLCRVLRPRRIEDNIASRAVRSEEHTSELQSHLNLVCRLLLEKKKKTKIQYSEQRVSRTSRV